MKSPLNWNSADGLVSRSLLVSQSDGATVDAAGFTSDGEVRAGSQCRVRILVQDAPSRLNLPDPFVSLWLAGASLEVAPCEEATKTDAAGSGDTAGHQTAVPLDSSFSSECVVRPDKPLCASADTDSSNTHKDSSAYSECCAEVVIGEADTEVDRLLERCARSLRAGDRCRARLRLRTDHLPGAWTSEHVTLHCTLTVESARGGQHYHTMTPSQMLAAAERARLHGNRLFTAGRTVDAFYQYQQALALLVYVPFSEDMVMQERVEEARHACRSNLSACQLRRRRPEAARAAADRVLQHQPDNLRCLYRRGAASLQLQDLERAEQDLQRVLQLQPGNSAATEKLEALRRRQKQVDQHTAGFMTKYFSSA